MNTGAQPSPFTVPNVRLFIAFRVFFNARFYYPIFTILFLDFGLSISDFALLNSVWAVSIVVCEVPLGALADIVGRKKLVVGAGVLMVLEMACLLFAPKGRPSILFLFFLMNRLLSGAAEASASGADEALAYDALIQEGKSHLWDRVLAAEMRIRSIALIIALSVGAAVYDPSLMQHLANLVGIDATVTQDMTLRFPLILCFGMAILALLTAVRMKEIDLDSDRDAKEKVHLSVGKALGMTLDAGRWILRTPFALLVILGGLVFDHVIRMLMTLGSQYYRMIQLPEATFGLIGSARSLIGLVLPSLALVMVRRFSPRTNLFIMAGVTWVGLFGMSFFWPYYGLIPTFIVWGGTYFVSFFVSRYLNKIAESSQRATVLSFKGLSFNLAYGMIGIVYSVLIYQLKAGADQSSLPIIGKTLDDQAFAASVGWFPWYFLAIFGIFCLYAHFKANHDPASRKPGGQAET